MRPGIRRVLLIGVGGGTHAKQFVRYYPEVEVDAVDVDPAVIDVAQRYFDVRPGARLRLHTRDGGMFLKSRPERYDLVIIDASVRTRYGATIPPHLVSREFFKEIEEKLNDGGIVHYHVFQGRDTPFCRALYKTLESVFPAVLVFGESEFVASKAPVHYSAADLKERAVALRAHLPYIDSHIDTMATSLPRVDDVPIMTDDYAPVDLAPQRPLGTVKRLLLLIVLVTACKRQEGAPANAQSPGDAGRGKLLIEQYGCHACHQVPGIEGPAGMVGPPLEYMASRNLIAGKVPNTADNMIRYLQNPREVHPEGTMPDLNVTPTDAGDLTAFLRTLK